jgi:hypothetical protein
MSKVPNSVEGPQAQPGDRSVVRGLGLQNSMEGPQSKTGDRSVVRDLVLQSSVEGGGPRRKLTRCQVELSRRQVQPGDHRVVNGLRRPLGVPA